MQNRRTDWPPDPSTSLGSRCSSLLPLGGGAPSLCASSPSPTACSSGSFSEGVRLSGEQAKKRAHIVLPLVLNPRWPWPPPLILPSAPLASSLAETLLRQRSSNLLFPAPTLGRKQFREENCKLAFVVEPTAPGLGWLGLWCQSPRLLPPACGCQVLSSGWLRCGWCWLQAHPSRASPP